MRKFLTRTQAPPWRRLRTLHTAIGLVAAWGATAQGFIAKVAMELQRLWRGMVGQTLRRHRRFGDAMEEFMRRRAEQVQVYVDAQDRRCFGDQALCNYSSYVGRAARHDNTVRSRTNRKTRKPLQQTKAQREELTPARWHEVAQNSEWWRDESAATPQMRCACLAPNCVGSEATQMATNGSIERNSARGAPGTGRRRSLAATFGAKLRTTRAPDFAVLPGLPQSTSACATAPIPKSCPRPCREERPT